MTNRPICAVCHRPIMGEVFTLGPRHYDEEHFRRLARENGAAAGPLLVEVGLVVLFAAVVAVLAGLIKPDLSGTSLLVIGIIVAIIPAGIWLMAFLQQDRLEPEPKRLVFGVFLLGALLAEAIGQPLIRDFFGVQTWLHNDLVTGLLGSILIVGFTQEFLKYAAVRYTVFHAPEFDERVDGIIYGAAAGLGYATMMNLQYVVGNGGVNLGVGAIQVAVNALAQASFSGVVGYFLGRAKFEHMGALWMPAGLTAAAILNGIVTYGLGEVTSLNSTVRSGAFNEWYGLVLAVIVAGATFVVLFSIVRRLNAATIALAERQAAAGASA